MAQQTTAQYSLMPLPKQVKTNSDSYLLDNKFTVTVNGPASQRMNDYAERFLRRLSQRTCLFFSQKYIRPDSLVAQPALTINYKSTEVLRIGLDESYSLKTTQSGISVEAQTDIGAMRALETLLQLLAVSENGYIFPGIEINDSPRFSWRGLMMDCSRHFMPIDVIKRNIDGMAAVKLNVFHWHLTDDQGFRVECKNLPLLHENASDGNYYTQLQIKEIIKYANDRGIRVIPEFDIPGHCTSWLAAYPKLSSGNGPIYIERRWGVLDQVFNPTIEETYEFFDKFFEEMSRLFNDEYIHIGGDENNGKQWNTNKDIQEFMKKNNIADNHALQTWFNKRIQKILAKYGKKMMGWDEILQPELPKDIVVHSWRGMKYLSDAAKKGYNVILSNGYYIDLVYPARDHYLIDPAPDSLKLTDEENSHVLGGEATMWAELVTPENVDSRIWPRTAAIAERFWSTKETRNVDDMYNRLDRISFLLEEHGLTHLKNQDLMLRRLANNQETEALKTLVSVLEPVKQYERHRHVKYYTTYSPYTRVVDAAAPESMESVKFNRLVSSYLKGDKQSLAEIKNRLLVWKENNSKLIPVLAKAPALKEIGPASEKLSKLAEVGLKALDYIESGKKPDEEFKQFAASLFKDLKDPIAETRIMIAGAIENLLAKLN